MATHNLNDRANVRPGRCNYGHYFQGQLKLTLVSQSDVIKEVQRMKNKKSVGLDSISVYVLKESICDIIEPVTYLINKSIVDGVVPDKWKVAKIVPIHKKRRQARF